MTASVPGRLTDPLACVFTVAAAWQCAQFGVALCVGCACVVSVAESVPWHSVQLLVAPIAVFQVYPWAAAALCPLLWQRLTPQLPNVPPVSATALAAAGVYAKLAANVTDPFACVATVAVAWQSLQSAPAPVSVVRCGPCEFVASVVLVALWHSVQLFVPPPAPCSTCTPRAPPRSARCCGRGSPRSSRTSRRSPPPRSPPPACT